MCVVAELQRDQDALEHTHEDQAEDDGERYPQQEMHPERRIDIDLHPECCPHDDEADDQDDEDDRPVAGIGK